jgi:quinol monooxygenase YgiN
MVTVGLLIRVEAKPDKVPEVEATLKSVVDLVREEGLAVVWFALRLGPTTFAIFDAFVDEADRDAHLEANGEALRAAGAELFAESAFIQHVDVIAAKLPGE